MMRRLTIMAAVMTASFVPILTACGGSDSSAGDDDGRVTLTLLDIEPGPEITAAIEEIIARFEADHPNVTIERQTMSLEDVLTTVKLTLSGDDPPDIVQNAQGYQSMGPLVKANLILSLSDYAAKWAWYEKQPESLLRVGEFTPDGKTWGSGELFGTSFTALFIGVYYDRAKLADLGLEVPQTLEEFEAALEAAKQAGETPLLFGNLEKWPGCNAFQALANVTSDPTQFRDWIYGNGDESIVMPEFEKAASILQRWAAEGYIPSETNGIDGDTAERRFADGDGLFFLTGTWYTPDLVEVLGEDVGFFLFPGEEAGQPLIATGTGENSYSIAAESEHADIAAEFLNLAMTSDVARQAWVEHGQVPLSGVDEATVSTQASGAFADVLDAYDQVEEANGWLPYMESSTPSAVDVMCGAVQELLAQRVSPRKALEQIQADYERFHQDQ